MPTMLLMLTLPLILTLATSAHVYLPLRPCSPAAFLCLATPQNGLLCLIPIN
jgi:hypothetical protein